MPRFPQPSQADSPVSVSLDGAFVGIDSRRESDFGDAAAGRVAEAQNVRFENGDAVTRWGCVAPVHFNPAFQRIFGSGVFSDPAGYESLVVADRETTWNLADCRTPTRIPLPTGVVINGKVSLLQAFNQLLMFRGPDQDSLIWGGGFSPWSKAHANQDMERPGYLAVLPRAEWGLLVANRVFVPVSRDEIAWSDILEPNRFDLTINKARFNQGEDDSIVAAAPFQGSRIVVFKDQSIWYLNNVGGDMSQITIDRLPGKIGCLARESVQDIGGDLIWLASDGVYSLSQTEQGQLRGATLPISAPIDKVMRRVNWGRAHQASSAFANQKYMLAVPLDGSEHNNAILVYDLLIHEWVSVDTYAAPPPEMPPPDPVPPSEFTLSSPANGPSITMGLPLETPSRIPAPAAQLVSTDLFGERTAFLVDTNRILALGHGEVDRINTTEEIPIATRIKTRGYMLAGLRIKALRNLAVIHATRDAETSVTVQTDGISENIPLQLNRTRDRTKYRISGKPPFRIVDGENFTIPQREDYAWKANDAIQMPASGIPLNMLQEWDQGYVARRLGRSFSVTVSSTRGRLRLSAVQAEGISMGNTPNTRS